MLPLLLAAAVPLPAQEAVTIDVDVSKPVSRFAPVWAWVGHDEPNYTYSLEGRNLLTKLSHLSSSPMHDRTHNLLTSGDGTPALKWGSTNAFTRDAAGNPVYSWSILNQIFDTYKALGIIPLVEIGFMPQALSPYPDPYQHHWPQGPFATGWAYPPKDYGEWSELIFRWVRHLADRYGETEVAKWEWEVWNEPDIFYWHGTLEEYCKFYDYTVAAVRRALPSARVGGPATTGPANQRASDFLRAFLQHAATGQNYATGHKGVPLDFISFHAKGKATYSDRHVQLNLGAHLRDIEQGFSIIASFPALHQLPVILSESDPESCAACDAASHPENSYRLSSQYASYETALLSATLALAERRGIHLEGTLAWAFTFPGQPIFAGFRAFTTNGVDLPLLNAFRLFGQMQGERLAVESTGAVELDDLVKSSVRVKSDVNAIATRDNHTVRVLAWNYHDDSSQSVPTEIHLKIEGLPPHVPRVALEQWRVDHDHSNAFTAWQSMGSPYNPTPFQYRQLKAAGQLQRIAPRRTIAAHAGAVELKVIEPAQGVSLLNLTW